MHLRPIECLEQLIAQPGRFVLRGWPPPNGPWDRDICWIKEADGRDLVIRTPVGDRSPVELPIPIWEEFLLAQLIRQDGPEDFERGTVYRPTPDGGRRFL